jgi:hypothetical protein
MDIFPRKIELFQTLTETDGRSRNSNYGIDCCWRGFLLEYRYNKSIQILGKRNYLDTKSTVQTLLLNTYERNNIT